MCWFGVFCCRGVGGEVAGLRVPRPMLGVQGCRAVGLRVLASRFVSLKAWALDIPYSYFWLGFSAVGVSAVMLWDFVL